MITSADLGVCEPSEEGYTPVRRRLPPSSDARCIVIDGGQPNVDAAASIGGRGIRFDADLLASHTPEALAFEFRTSACCSSAARTLHHIEATVGA